MDKKEKIALISVGTNILLTGIKILLASVSGSIALLADAGHSASDIFVSALVLLGLKLSKKQQPKISSRIENIVTAIVSLFILAAGYKIFRKALFAPPYELQNWPLVIIGTLACIIIVYFLSHYILNIDKHKM